MNLVGKVPHFCGQRLLWAAAYDIFSLLSRAFTNFVKLGAYQSLGVAYQEEKDVTEPFTRAPYEKGTKSHRLRQK